MAGERGFAMGELRKSRRVEPTAFLAIAGAALLVGLFVYGTASGSKGAQQADPSGQGDWKSAAKLPIHASEMGAVSLGGRIYVGGGLAGPSNDYTGVTTTFQYYDPQLDRWYALAPLPADLHHLGLTTTNSAIYLTGGYQGDDFTPDMRAVWSYRPIHNVWQRVAYMPAPRAAHASVGIGDRLYVVGGVGTGSSALWVYDPETNTWDTSRPPLPTIREHLTAAEVGGKLYVIGGRWGGQGNMRTLEIYDPTTNTWTRGRDMPTARSGLTSAVVGGLIHVTGGEDLGSSHTFDEHEVYDPATDTWATYPKLPTSRHGLPSAALNGRWYVIGGGTQAGGGTYSTLSNLVEVFVP